MTTDAPELQGLVTTESLADIKRMRILSRRSASADLMGNYKSAFKGTGIIFADIREYQPGDDVKHIHWRATARTGTVYVKSYEEERQLTVMALVDVSASTYFGAPRSRYRRGLETAAVIATLAHRCGDKFGIALFADDVVELIHPRAHRTHLQRILGTLALARQLPRRTDVGAALRKAFTTLRRPAVVFVISDFLSPPFEDDLSRLASKHDVSCLMLGGRELEDLPRAGIVNFADAESGETIMIDTSHEESRAYMARLAEKRTSHMRTLCRSCAAGYAEVRDSPALALQHLLNRRSREKGVR